MYDQYLRGQRRRGVLGVRRRRPPPQRIRPGAQAAGAGRQHLSHDRLRAAAPRRAVLHRERDGRRGGRARSAQRRSAGHGLLAGLQPQRLLQAVHARRLEDDHQQPVQDRAEPRHPGALLARIGLQDRHGHGRTVGRRGRSATRRSAAAAAACSSAAASAAGSGKGTARSTSSAR